MTGKSAFAAAVTAVYCLIAVLFLASAHFDVSELIVAGDRYVDVARVPVAIDVRKNSDGYDGQFYFRLAVEPLPNTTTGSGVTFDRPVYRSQRIGYPLLVWIASLGRASLVPIMLLAVNLLGIFVMARSAMALTTKLDLSRWFAPAVMAWPGITVTLLHDTTEIVASAWLLLSIEAMADRRTGRTLVSGTLAVLTRETSAIFFAGAALVMAWTERSARRLAIGLFPLGCYALWRLFLVWHWHNVAHAAAMVQGDMGWPLAGFFKVVHDSATLSRQLSPRPVPNMIRNLFVLITACGLFATALRTAWLVPAAMRGGGMRRAIAAGWVGLAVLLATLSASGPWIDPTGYFRAFSEFWMVSMLVLAGARLTLPKMAIAIAPVAWLVCVFFAV